MNTRATPGVNSQGAEGPGVVSSGWLGTQSVFEHHQVRRMGRAMWVSAVGHGVVALGLVALVIGRPAPATEAAKAPDYKLVYIQQPGPGGGGGGSPAPTPPRRERLEIPKPDLTPPPLPVPVETVALLEPKELPQLVAPVFTPDATVAAVGGESLISLAPLGGGGAGGGAGEGQGRGVGEGETAGTGGGAYDMGTRGLVGPTLTYQHRPQYTGEAMRAKIQGTVVLEAVVRPDGTVADLRVIRSLDARFGLDQAAIAAAGLWKFKPATLNGETVPVRVQLELTFNLY